MTCRIIHVLGATAVALGVASSPLHAQVFVDPELAPGGDGVSWATAFGSLEEAVAQTAGGGATTFFVRGGQPTNSDLYTYARDFPLNTMIFEQGSNVFGGFTGDESQLNDRVLGTNHSVLSGEEDDNDEINDQVSTVVTFDDQSNDVPVRFDGFRIQDCRNTTRFFPDPCGPAGLQSDTCDIRVSNCIFTELISGGGFFDEPGSIAAMNVICDGFATGGQYLGAEVATVTNCDFYDNTSVSCGTFSPDAPTVVGTLQFSLLGNDKVALTNTRIGNNGVTGPGSCTAGGNVIGGGLVYLQRESNTGAMMTVTNCTMHDNVYGGTINGPGSTGAGIHVGFLTVPISPTIVVNNSIAWDNGLDPGGTLADNIDGALAGTTVNHTVVEGTWPATSMGTNNVDTDPLLTFEGQLQSGSSAIDLGDTTFVPDDALDVDNDGNTMEKTPDLALNDRVLNGGVSALPDAGAYEFVLNCFGDLDGDQQVGFTDLVAILAAWGPCPGGNPCAADLNGDLDVGFPDLVLLLANWGKCTTSPETGGGISPRAIAYGVPQSVEDCFEQATSPEKLNACLASVLGINP